MILEDADADSTTSADAAVSAAVVDAGSAVDADVTASADDAVSAVVDAAADTSADAVKKAFLSFYCV